MKGFKRTGVAVAIAALFALGTSTITTTAEALPNGVQAKPAVENSNYLQNVRDGRRHYRGRHHRRHGYRDDWDDGWWGINPGAAIALGVTGALINEGLRSDYEGGSSAAVERCAARFKSFEYDTGMYTTYGGDRRLCPYLR